MHFNVMLYVYFSRLLNKRKAIAEAMEADGTLGTNGIDNPLYDVAKGETPVPPKQRSMLYFNLFINLSLS